MVSLISQVVSVLCVLRLDIWSRTVPYRRDGDLLNHKISSSSSCHYISLKLMVHHVTSELSKAQGKMANLRKEL